ncbi:hypothetical protein Poli38472_009613 [Pythium oligandrum]|uniref:Palmitoyltransferase n=1 Tax=Pythium oligandrum TaxID=41045 RepID=A0A8K1CG42_PYTOL|nr:hypothetical protein Poli38472_009613 [Pythium oligandrum]|eukprot:TMW62120.1 hypothetical protein Poli38472_009613 [Pythium oligandrum]
MPSTDAAATATHTMETVVAIADDDTRRSSVSSTASSTSEASMAAKKHHRGSTGPVRKNGLQGPVSSDQMIACTGHIVSAICFYVASGSILLHGRTDASRSIYDLTLVTLGVHVPVFLLLLVSWVSCVRIDPALDVEVTMPNGWFGVKLRGRRWETARYCAICRKAVPGLDHHCTWLQTCVGKSNYAQFFTIACTGTIQFLSQALYASFCIAWLELPFDPEGNTRMVMEGVMAACVLISVPCTLMYFVLLGFHVYLYFLGYGTYEWMLRRRREHRARSLAAAAAAHDERHQSSGGMLNSVRTSLRRLSSRSSQGGRSRHASSVGSNNEFTSADDKNRRASAPAAAMSPKPGQLTAL